MGAEQEIVIAAATRPNERIAMSPSAGACESLATAYFPDHFSACRECLERGLTTDIHRCPQRVAANFGVAYIARAVRRTNLKNGRMRGK